MPLSQFHAAVRDWFESRFEAPTEAQSAGWPAIARGDHTLISAPTGSGKTLAAFLVCIDRLLREAVAGKLSDEAHVVYVSPLKALSNDVHRNLEVPLREITAIARAQGLELPEIRVAVRTGDTPAYERQVMARRPPHIWITTPESLYILLTSESGRRGLAAATTLILDEIHAVADDKRGSHLSLSVERLCALARRSVTRIGLSATQRPIEEVARFLVGSSNLESDGTPRCRIVDTGHRRKMDLAIDMADDELGPIATIGQWDRTVDRIVQLANDHRTTIVFVNTRRLVERVAHILSARMGEDAVGAHHGSLSRKARFHTEQRLKNAEIRVCVATASLELGIDVGAVELVCQIGSPRSIGVLLQRVGRSGHWLGGTPKGRLFPLTRDELIECAALLLAVRRGDLDTLRIPPWPLDVLAQQIVAMCAVEPWRIEDLWTTVCRAFPYRELPRKEFDDVLSMLAEGVSTRLGYRSSYLHLDRVNGLVRARRAARIASLTSGGAIPDTADYDVTAEPEGTFVGTVNEDFAVESMAGDVFLLGNTAWRIRRIEQGRLRVEDAHGQAPNIPFWMGEAPGRTTELSQAVSDIRQGIHERIAIRESCLDWLRNQVGLSAPAAAQAVDYIGEGLRVLGTVPGVRRVVAERFFDESGGMQLVLHGPFGSRVNRAWGLALRKRFCRSFDFELQAAATDDGINLSLGPQHSFPLEDVFRFLHSGGVEDTLTQAVLASPIFAVRWRWTLARSLMLPRMKAGKKTPAFIQRMRADDLLAAVFPAQAGCQDNRDGPDVAVPEHPLVFEALRDCLTEALDVEGLRHVLRAIERGEIETLARDTSIPSVFSHQILNTMPYAFLDDAPLEERRARAVILRRALPDSAGELGRLDPEAIRSAAADAWPPVRDAEELHDLLLGMFLFPESEIVRLPGECLAWFEDLRRAGRALMASYAGHTHWLARERAESLGIPGFQTPGSLTPACVSPVPSFEQDAVVRIVRGWVEVSGPLTPSGLAHSLGLSEDSVRIAFAQLEGEGLVLRGRFTGEPEEEFCDRRILARIHRATIARLRREIEPVEVTAFLDFLISWQHLGDETRLRGEAGVLEVIEQLQGFEAAAAAWEAEILPARVEDYEPEWLDGLCLAGEVAWGRWTRRQTQAEVPARRPGMTRTAPVGLAIREDIAWLVSGDPAEEQALSLPARATLALLGARGALFFPELVAGTRHLPSEVEEGLWQLVAAGLVTADAFSALRALASGATKRSGRSTHRRRRPRRTREGRWSLLEPTGEPPDDIIERRANQLLRRYGVICRELLTREPGSPSWRDLLRVLRRSEARGEIRGGRFIIGLEGEQYALPEAIDALRTNRRRGTRGRFVRVSACDPLNLIGILTPGARVSAVLGNRVIFRDGVPVAALELGKARTLAPVDPSEQKVLSRLLDVRPATVFSADMD
jgi:ATP-dependent helicase Lhr and Lhr-like helicase